MSDGAHDGNPDFFFLPPLFPDPKNQTEFEATEFNGTLRPAVEICQLGEPSFPGGPRECEGAALKRFAGSEVLVSLDDQQYLANWHTDETYLDVTKFYRINVLVGTERLGFADIDPVSTGRDLKSVETGEYIGLVDGRTLPIKFRIENRALCGTPEFPCAAETIDLETGGGITLVTETETFQFDVPPGTEATFGGAPVTEITFNLETCDDIDVDLPLFGDCLRVTTFFDVEGASGTELVLTNAAQVSLCQLDPGLVDHLQEHLITLHQQDGALIRALPHVTPNCETITTAPGLWERVRSLAARVVAPRMLHARSARRSAAFNLGGGGETDRFGSSCDGAASAPLRASPAGAPRVLLVDCPPPSGPAPAATATRATARTSSDFQFALPAMMDYVNPDDASRTLTEPTTLLTEVKITDWNGAAVPGATVTFTEPVIEGPAIVIGTAVSNDDGIAAIQWAVEVGTNTLVASGRGIAGPNNYPDAEVRPFMPDISLEPSAQTPVALGTGRLTFTATVTVEPTAEGSWARTGELPAPRRDHSAVLLADGDVLIIGGTATGAFLYHPSSGAFTATEGSPVFHHSQGMTATLLSDGRVLTVGGGSAPFRAQIYDPSNGSFTEVAAQTTASRAAHTATLLADGRVLLAGGHTNAEGGPLTHAEAEIFDPSEGTFTAVGDLNVDRHGHAATLLPDGRVLIVGGTRTTTVGSGTCLASAELFDPETMTFSLAEGGLAEARCALAFTGAPLLGNGKVLVIGWFSDGAELFDPAAGTFSATDDMSIDRTGASATVLADGRVLVAGGTSSSETVLGSAEIYDPVLGIFTPAANLITGRLQHSGTRLLDGRILVVGGSGGEGDLSTAELFSLSPPTP